MKNEMNTVDNMQDRVAPVATTDNETEVHINKVETNKTKEEGMKANSENTETRRNVMQMETGFFKTETVIPKDTQDVLKPLTYIDLGTNEVRTAHLLETTPECEKFFRALILNGSGSISKKDDCLEIYIAHLGRDAFTVEFFKDGCWMLECMYTDSEEKNDINWQIMMERYPRPKSISKPSAPWLAIIAERELNNDLDINDFILQMVKAWRKITKTTPTMQLSSLSDNQRTFTIRLIRETENIRRINRKLEKQVEMFKKENAELTRQIQSPAHLQQEIEHLHKDVTAKEGQIQLLQTMNSGLLAGIQQQVDAQVSTIKKEKEELQLYVELLEEERDDQKRSNGKLESTCKYYQQLLLKHGLSSNRIFNITEEKPSKAG